MRKYVDQLTRSIDNAKIDSENRQAVVSFVIANHVSCEVDVPTSPVTSPKRLFSEQHSESVKEKICEFNEWIVMDADVAFRLVYQMWLLRYRLVHEPKHFTAVSLMNSMMSSGSAVEIPEKFVKAINDTGSDAIAELSYYVDKTLKEE